MSIQKAVIVPSASWQRAYSFFVLFSKQKRNDGAMPFMCAVTLIRIHLPLFQYLSKNLDTKLSSTNSKKVSFNHIDFILHCTTLTACQVYKQKPPLL